MGNARTWGYTSGMDSLAISRPVLGGGESGGGESDGDEGDEGDEGDPDEGGADEDEDDDEARTVDAESSAFCAMALARSSADLEDSASCPGFSGSSSSAPLASFVRLPSSSPAELTHRFSFSDLEVVCKLRCGLCDCKTGRGNRSMYNEGAIIDRAANDADDRVVGRHRRWAADRMVARKGSMSRCKRGEEG